MIVLKLVLNRNKPEDVFDVRFLALSDVFTFSI
jgi:hypothetical protein